MKRSARAASSRQTRGDAVKVEQPQYALVTYPNNTIGCVPFGEHLDEAVAKHGAIVFAREDAELCVRPTYDATNWDANVIAKPKHRYRHNADYHREDDPTYDGD
jgi:hypothetical protein